MNAEVFLDTNILLYACSNAPADRDKQRLTSQLILSAHFALSAQVLHEFIANALKNKALEISETHTDATLEMATHVPVLPITQELIMSAVILRRTLSISHWDSTILAAAQELHCHTLYSEDFNHGQVYGGVRVINPFLRKDEG